MSYYLHIELSASATAPSLREALLALASPMAKQAAFMVPVAQALLLRLKQNMSEVIEAEALALCQAFATLSPAMVRVQGICEDSLVMAFVALVAMGEEEGVKTPVLQEVEYGGVRLVLCEPQVFESATAPASSRALAPAKSMLKLCATLFEMPFEPALLRRALERLGAQQIALSPSSLLQGAADLQLLVRQEEEAGIAHYLFENGFAKNLYTQPVSVMQLLERISAVPYGRGQKRLSCRVREYWWGDTCVRIEAHPADVHELMLKTGHSPSSIRQDVAVQWQQFCAPTKGLQPAQPAQNAPL